MSLKTSVLKTILISFILNNIISNVYSQDQRYEPNWESLDNRPLPKWYDEAKLGIFIHWGVFSVPALGEWFWSDWKLTKYPNAVKKFMKDNFKENFTYQEFAPQFTAELFNPSDWAKLFKKSGAKYVVLTSKHHEGYTLWPSKNSWNWNAVDIGPKRDLIKSLMTEIKNTNLHFGLYHSLYEWFNPLYLSDKSKQFQTQEFVKAKTLPELYDIVKTYEPEVIWSDGHWEAPDSYWQSKEFLAWLYNESPVKDTVVTNDRWGEDTDCKHGGYWSCSDRYNPDRLQAKKWENAMTLDKKSWGLNRLSNTSDYLTIEELLQTLISTISYGGNLLVNVGPTACGRIPPIMEERLLQLGEWMDVNGKAIYNTKPWKYQKDTLTPGVWYTQATENNTVFALVTCWPESGVLKLQRINDISKPSMQINFYDKQATVQLKWVNVDNVTEIYFPKYSKVKWAWTLEISNI